MATGFSRGSDAEPERAWAVEVPANWSSLLGVEPAMGRDFEESEARSSCVTLVTHDTWRERLGGSAGAVGKTLELDSESCTVVGVLPEGFFFLDRSVRLFLPLSLDARPEERDSHSLGAFGRLAPGVSLREARAEMDLLMERWAIAVPDHHGKGHIVILEPFHADQVRNVRPALLVLMGAVCVLLLIVCSNVANLLLVRAESRRREFALRASLGAGRKRLVRQLLTESALLSLLGGGLGLLVSAWTLEGVLSLYPDSLPGAAEPSIDHGVLLFALALTLGTVFLFGLAPAVSAATRGPSEELNAGTHPRRKEKCRASPDPRGRAGRAQLDASGGRRAPAEELQEPSSGRARLRSRRGRHALDERVERLLSGRKRRAPAADGAPRARRSHSLRRERGFHLRPSARERRAP